MFKALTALHNGMENNRAGLSYGGTGAALAVTLVIAFILCAVAQMILPGAQFSHMWLALFTAAPVGSAQAWVEGIIASVVVGLVLGHVFAFVYNWMVARR